MKQRPVQRCQRALDCLMRAQGQTTLHSRLYRLQPLGLGTASVESLTSYILRLSAAHQVPVWVLVAREIGPAFSEQTVMGKNGVCDLFNRLAGSLNGNNATAQEAARVLRNLTCHPELRRLTMLGCGRSVAPAPLMKVNQAWCPACLQDWKDRQAPIYYPLLWSLGPVTFCPAHHARLAAACTICDLQWLPITRHARAGFCPRCCSWLGARDTRALGDAPFVCEPREFRGGEAAHFGQDHL
jgi:TniQ